MLVRGYTNWMYSSRVDNYIVGRDRRKRFSILLLEI
jgi:hypothetical protein